MSLISNGGVALLSHLLLTKLYNRRSLAMHAQCVCSLKPNFQVGRVKHAFATWRCFVKKKAANTVNLKQMHRQ